MSSTQFTKPTRIIIMLDFMNRPSDKTLAYLRRLAGRFNGEFVECLQCKGKHSEWFLVFSFEPYNKAGSEDFWNRALMYNDLTEGF